MPTFIKNGGQFLGPKDIWIKNGGAWQKAKGIWRMYGGAWVQVWPNTPSAGGGGGSGGGSLEITAPTDQTIVIPYYNTLTIDLIAAGGTGGSGSVGLRPDGGVSGNSGTRGSDVHFAYMSGPINFTPPQGVHLFMANAGMSAGGGIFGSTVPARAGTPGDCTHTGYYKTNGLFVHGANGFQLYTGGGGGGGAGSPGVGPYGQAGGNGASGGRLVKVFSSPSEIGAPQPGSVYRIYVRVSMPPGAGVTFEGQSSSAGGTSGSASIKLTWT